MPSHLIGKRVFVDVQAYRRPEGPKYLDLSFTGEIVAVAKQSVSVRRHDTGGVEEVVADEYNVQVAEPGEYVLRSSGAVVPQPDYTIEYTHIDITDVHGSGIGIGWP